jgi:hypothetical protein
MSVQADIPNARYEWQRSYLVAALETDSRLLAGKINEARREIRRRLSDCTLVDESEQSAVANALNALTTLERERLNPAVDSAKHATIFLDLAGAGSESNRA